MTRRSAVLQAALVFAAAPAWAQTVVELRASSTHYRFADFSHTFASGAVVDVLYLGADGSDELYAGAGYQWKISKAVVLTPLLYGVAGKQAGERGVVAGAILSVDTGGWKTVGFIGNFFRLAGDVPDYFFLDTLDATRVLGRWELGVSSGFFRQSGDWNPLVGPVVKRNDSRGSWALSARFGSDTDVRLVRVLTF